MNDKEKITGIPEVQRQLYRLTNAQRPGNIVRDSAGMMLGSALGTMGAGMNIGKYLAEPTLAQRVTKLEHEIKRQSWAGFVTGIAVGLLAFWVFK